MSLVININPTTSFNFAKNCCHKQYLDYNVFAIRLLCKRHLHQVVCNLIIVIRIYSTITQSNYVCR